MKDSVINFIKLTLFMMPLNLAAADEIMVINNEQDLILDGLHLHNAQNTCLVIRNSKNVVVKNSTFKNCYGVGISIIRSDNVKIINNKFENLNGGVYALRSSKVNVVNNRFKNVSRKGKLHPSRGQFVQFDKVKGGLNSITGNTGSNEFGLSDPEDLISLYKSSGIHSSPIKIEDNCFIGGGPSKSGGGILIGDRQGGHVIVRNNTLINVGQYGIGIAGGREISIIGNKVYGIKNYFTNVGIYVWNTTPQFGVCTGIEVKKNKVDFVNAKGKKNPRWNAGNCGEIDGWQDNSWHDNLVGLTCCQSEKCD